MSSTLVTKPCNGCTACCDGWLKTNVDGHDVSPGNPCKHCAGGGCSIYAMRPDNPCATYFCGWQVDPEMPDWMIPKKSKIIITLNFTWEKPSGNIPVHVATAAGPKIPGRTIAWLRDYARAKGHNFLCSEPLRQGKTYTGESRRFGIGHPRFEADVEAWVGSGYDFHVTPGKSQVVVGNTFIAHDR